MTTVELTANTAKKYHYLTLIAALLAMIGPFTIDAYLPAFPDMELTFEVNRTALTQSLAVYLFAFAVSTLFWGPLADRIGRKRVILISLALYILASIASALAESYQAFLVFRVLQGLTASGSLIAARAMIRDTHSAEDAHRAMAHVILLFALAPAIAPVLGGWLNSLYGWQSIFWFLSIFGLLLIFLVVFIKETLASEHIQSFHPVAVFKVYMTSFRQRRFIALILSLSFAFCGLFLYIAGAPTVIYQFLGLGNADFGWQFIPMVMGMMLGALASARLSSHWPRAKTVSIGFVIMIVAVLINLLQAVYFSASLVVLVGPLVLYAFGLALTMPAISILALDCFPRHRGTASSMQSCLQMLAMAVVASLAVPLLQSQLIHFVLGQAVFLLLAYSLWVYSSRSH